MNDASAQALRLQAAAALKLREQEAFERHKADPWAFFTERLTLLDPLAPSGAQIAPYPDFDYTRGLVLEIHEHNQVLVWKSRRMIASWTGIGYAVYLAMHFPYVRCFFISRKEGENDGEGARELIWRAKFLVENLRGDGPKPVVTASKLQLAFENGSTITGVSSEPNQMRQVSANFVMGDELGFWDRPKESYAALKPTLEARGKFLGLSSSAEGFFKETVYDLGEDAWQDFALGTRAERPKTAGDVIDYTPGVTPGMQAWTNGGNGFRVLALHYTADPRKRTEEWKERESKGVPRSIWLQEYEMHFNVRAGRAVFADEWDRGRMLSLKRLQPERNRPLWCSLDFGYHRPALTVGQFRYGLQMLVLRAYMGEHIQFDLFMRQCLQLLTQWFPDRDTDPSSGDFMWACDAAGKQKKATGLPEVTILRRTFGIHPRFRYSEIEPTVDKLRGYMARTHKGEPCFIVERNATTRIIVDGLDGAYAYPEAKPGAPEPTTPEKEGFYEHIFDTLRYAVLNFDGTRFVKRGDVDRIARADILAQRSYVL